MTHGNILKRVFFQPQKKFVVGQRKAIGDNRHGGGIIPLMMQPKREDYRKFEIKVVVRTIMSKPINCCTCCIGCQKKGLG